MVNSIPKGATFGAIAFTNPSMPTCLCDKEAFGNVFRVDDGRFGT
jgi:hypothetical protein